MIVLYLLFRLEDMICADVDRIHFFKVLRLLCLQSLTSGGIRTSKYEGIKRLIVQNYGYEESFTLANLERAGLLKKKDIVLVDGPSLWQGLRKQLRLIDDEGSKVEDFSSVAAGYSPLTVRLVQSLGSSTGWAAVADVMKLLPGPLLEVTQGDSPEELSEALGRARDLSHLSLSTLDDHPTKRNILVFVVGGLTYLEIAAFRCVDPCQLVMSIGHDTSRADIYLGNRPFLIEFFSEQRRSSTAPRC